MNAHRNISRNRAAGFTLVELSIGLVVVSLVMCALAAFTLASAEAWKQGATTNVNGAQTVAAIPIIGALAGARLDNEIGSCAAVGGYFAGSLTTSTGQQASLLLWPSDKDGDKNIDLNEIELIEYDATDHVIYKWTSTSTGTFVNYTLFTSSYIATFKGIATRTPLARNIDGMQFFVQTPTSLSQLPLVEYRLYFNRGGQTRIRYGAVCLRAPTTPTGMTPT